MPPVVPRRDQPHTWYPAGVSEISARWLTLAKGERVRVVLPEAARDSDPTVLLLHGWGCNAFHFRRLIPALRQRGMRPIAVDLRGHGLSHKPNDASAYTSTALADFMCDVIDALGLVRVSLVGHSLGAAIALDTALNEANRVSWLLLLNPVGLTRLAVEPLLSRLPVRAAERMPAALSRAVGFGALHLAYGPRARPDPGDLEQYLFPTLLPGGRFGMLAYAPSFSWKPRPFDVLQSLRVPTRVLLGEYDRVVKQREAVRLLSRLSGIGVEVVPGAGHVLAEEVAERVGDAGVELAAAPNAALRGQAATP